MAGTVVVRTSRATRRRSVQRLAVAGVVAAAVPLALWAVPAAHPRPGVRVTWTDGGDQVTQWIVRRGLDRHGWVHQERTLTWTAATPAALNGVRANPPVELPPTDSWLLQYTEYGNNHVYLPGGLSLTDAGLIRTLPYSLMAAAALATRAALIGLARAWRRFGPAR